jgi:hypothetical protein
MYLGKQAEYEDVWNNINNLERRKFQLYVTTKIFFLNNRQKM